MPDSADTPTAAQHAAMLSTSEDTALIRAVARKDRKAFERLYYVYAPRLGRYLSRMLKDRELVDEALNDVMLVVWQNAARFDPTASKLSTWMFGIAHNKALKALSRSSRYSSQLLPLDYSDSEETSELQGGEDPASKSDPHNPEQTVMGRQLGHALQQGLASLSHEHRAVLELAFAEDRSYQEIAAITGCPVNTVKTRMFYARKNLAQFLASVGLTGYTTN
jgi:RNA polymerase sigma-70 factor, ECF subfamily